ncbi:MAG: T9SS type A sorting domain-containing protein [Bacteroidales bacterium]
MKKTNTNFENKLKAYSTLALGVLGVGALNAQVVYHDVNPDRILTATAAADTMLVDLNADGINDFQFNLRTYGTANIQADIRSIDTNNLVLGTLQAYTSLGYALPLALNAPINSTNTNWHAGVGQMVLASVYNSTNYGTCGGAADKYLGVRFKAGANTHYGWIRVSDVATTGANVTVKDWAYNSTAGAAINAGQGAGVGVNEPKLENVSIFATKKQININFRSSLTGSVRVINLLGQEIANQKINDKSMIINLENQKAGLYIIDIQSNEGVISKKINLD